MQDNNVQEAEVIVIGGGPIGLAMALELGQQGIKTLLAEREVPQDVIRAKAGSVSFRSVEYCRRWGVQQELYDCGFPEDYPLDTVFCTDLTGHGLARHEAASMADFKGVDVSPVRKQRCPQMWFDPILQRAAESLPNVDLHFGCSVMDLENSDSGVVVNVQDSDDAKETWRARYAVLCEGAGGRFRPQLSVEMVGRDLINYTVSILFECPTFLDATGFGPASRYIFIGENGVWGNITVQDGSDLWRLSVLMGEERVDMEAFDPHYWIAKAFGDTVPDYRLISARPWRRSATVADKYRNKSVFLAGDVAHTMSNTGGFGMNTGLSDVVNLGWKLAANLRGWGGEALLGSYQSERQPIARRNIAFADEILRHWQIGSNCGPIHDSGAEGEAARSTLSASLLSGTFSEWGTMGAALGYRYEASPVCVDDGSDPVPDAVDTYIPQARPGARAPHFWLDKERSVLDLFKSEYVLLQFNITADTAPLVEAATDKGVPLLVVPVADAAARDLYEADLALVRPDGHVAWRGDSLGSQDMHELIDRVRGAGRI